MINNQKNHNREEFTFANINLLGKCNVDCFFCLGKDFEEVPTLSEKFSCNNQLTDHFTKWHNWDNFIDKCKELNIKKIYLTGQNTDALLYKYPEELIKYLHKHGFGVGLRTNGYLAEKKMDIMNMCDCSAGISIHTLNPVTNKMVMGRSDIPDWKTILPQVKNLRVSIVLNRCNRFEFFDLIKFLSTFDNIKYIQVRRVSTDTRQEVLAPDQIAYEKVYTQVKEIFPLIKKFYTDAESYEIFGKEVVFWRTTKTSVNSINYFSDGTLSEEYFVVEGYIKQKLMDEKLIKNM